MVRRKVCSWVGRVEAESVIRLGLFTRVGDCHEFLRFAPAKNAGRSVGKHSAVRTSAMTVQGEKDGLAFQTCEHGFEFLPFADDEAQGCGKAFFTEASVVSELC